jgi:hypothetical protein
MPFVAKYNTEPAHNAINISPVAISKEKEANCNILLS